MEGRTTVTRKQISQDEANRMHRETIEKAARDARKEVHDLDRQIAELQARRATAKADADRLTKLVVKTWGMGK
jgi:peptidoglycan hydrolase CwlO-like protein